MKKHFNAGRKQSAEHVRKRVESRRRTNENYMPSGYTVWNKGKTKETDERVKKYADSMRLGRKFHTAGYVLVYKPEHPRADRVGYVLEHILVAEQMLGRFMYAHEKVHHKDGDRTNNVPENIQIITQGNHLRIHKPSVKFSKEDIELLKRLAKENISQAKICIRFKEITGRTISQSNVCYCLKRE
jgi:hypothetical protein